jgi:hypothetical protein
MSANSSVNKEIRHVFVTPKPAKMVISEAERSLGWVASPRSLRE